MFRVLLSLCTLLFAGFVSAQTDMKIEGSCRGQFRGTDISFKYFSAFNGCVNKSKAEVAFTSGQSPKLKGTRILSNGLDTYTFKNYWLVFPDSTGNTHGDFKYRDSSGTIRSVRLECQVLDYEYSECL